MSQQYVDEARKYLGTPFAHHGRGKGTLDCAGLIIVPAKNLGRVLQDIRTYKREAYKGQLRRHIESQLGAPLAKTDWYVGCVAMMNTDAEPHHLGILGNYIYGGFSLIHTSGEHKKVVEHVLDSYFRRRIVAVYRSPV